MRIRFRFRWIPFVAAMLAVALGIALGRWQTRRAIEKETRQANMIARAAQPALDLNAIATGGGAVPDYRRVDARGEFLRSWPVYLDNRQYNGTPGFYVLMPFRLAGTARYVLVNRGWVRRDFADRAKLPPLITPAGQIEIQGTARQNPERLLQLGQDNPLHPGAVRENLRLPEFARASGLNMLPFLLLQTSDTGDGLVREWPQPAAGSERNRGYAFQWYALAAMAFVFFVVTGFRRGTKQEAAG